MRIVSQSLDTGGRVVGIVDGAGKCLAVREDDDKGRPYSWAMSRRVRDDLRAMVERVARAAAVARCLRAAVVAVALLAGGAAVAHDGAACPPALTISAADTATELAILDEACPHGAPWKILGADEPAPDDEQEE